MAGITTDSLRSRRAAIIGEAVAWENAGYFPQWFHMNVLMGRFTEIDNVPVPRVIKKTYDQLSRIMHPDKLPTGLNEEETIQQRLLTTALFQRLGNAHEQLVQKYKKTAWFIENDDTGLCPSFPSNALNNFGRGNHDVNAYYNAPEDELRYGKLDLYSRALPDPDGGVHRDPHTGTFPPGPPPPPPKAPPGVSAKVAYKAPPAAFWRTHNPKGTAPSLPPGNPKPVRSRSSAQGSAQGPAYGS